MVAIISLCPIRSGLFSRNWNFSAAAVSELRTCWTRVWPVPFSDFQTWQTRGRSCFSPNFKPAKPPNKGSACSFLWTPILPNQGLAHSFLGTCWTRVLSSRCWVRSFLQTPNTNSEPGFGQVISLNLPACSFLNTRIWPSPYSEPKLRTRVWPGSFSELRNCQTRVRPVPFSELWTQTQNQGSALSFLQTPNLPNQGSAPSFLRTPNQGSSCHFSELQTCGTRVRSIAFSEFGTCRTRARPCLFPNLPNLLNQGKAWSFLLTPNLLDQCWPRSFLRTLNPNSEPGFGTILDQTDEVHVLENRK